MAIVGRATVVITALTDQFKADLRKAFAEVEVEADAAGARAGARFGDSFRRAASDAMKGMSFDGAEGDAAAAGSRMGSRLSSEFSKSSRDLGSDLGSGFSDIESEAGSSGTRAGEQLKLNFGSGAHGLGTSIDGDLSKIGDAAAREGEKAGKDLGSGIESGVKDGAERAATEAGGAGNTIANNFKGLDLKFPDFGGADFAAKLLALIPLIGVLGGAIAALVGGLAALAGAAAYAAGSLAIIATGVGALALAAGSGILAFGGIGKAVTALVAQQNSLKNGANANAKAQQQAADAVVTAQQRVTTATQGVADAEFNLARARRQAAEQAVQDEHSVQNAEYALAQAQLNAKQAQTALTQARQAAAQQLISMQLQLRGANIGVEQAQLSLQESQEAYQKTLSNPAASQEQRDQARIDLENAELTLDQAKNQKSRAEKDAEDANKKGVEGSDQVVKAKENEKNANHSVAEAEYALSQARQKQTDDAVASAHAVLDAQHAVTQSQISLANAQKALAEAQATLAAGGSAANTAAQNVKKAMADLGPDAQTFAKYLASLHPELIKIKQAAGSELFGPLTADLKQLVNGGFLDSLKTTLAEGGKGLAQFFGEIAKAINSPDIKSGLVAFAKSLTTVHANTGTSDFQDMGKILGDLLKIFVGLARAAEPTFHTFLTFLGGLTGKGAAAFSTGEGLKHITDTISSMGKVAGTFGHIFGDLFKIVLNVFGPGGGLKAGTGLLDEFSGYLDNLLKSTSKGGDKLKPIQDFFKNIQGPFKAIIGLIPTLLSAFAKMGEDGTLTKIADDIKKLIPEVAGAIQTFTDKVAPALIDIIGKIIKVFENIVNSPAFPTFVDTIKTVIGFIGNLVTLVTGSPLAGFAGVVVGIGAAFLTLKGLFDKSGVASIFKLFKGGFGDPKKLSLKDAQGPAGLLQGVRGRTLNEQVTPKTYDPVTGKVTKGKPVTQPTESNARGKAINAALTSPVGDLADKARQKLADTVPNKLSVLNRPLSTGRAGAAVGGAAKALGRHASGAASTIAVGLEIAKDFKDGKVKGLGDAIKKAGKLASDNLGTILTQFGPQIFSGIASGIGIAKDAITGLKDSTALASAATKVWTAIQAAFNFVMDANPVVLVIGAIVLLGVAIYEAYKHFKPFHDLVDKVWQALQKLWDIIWNSLKTAIEWIVKHFQLLLLALGPLGLAIDEIIFIFKHWHQIIGIVTGAIKAVIKFFESLPGKVSGFVGAVVGFVRDLPGQIIGFVGKLGSAAGRVGSSIVHGIVNAVSGIGESIGGFIGKIPGLITGFAGKIGDAALSIGKGIIGGIISGIENAGEFISSLATTLLNGFTGLVNQYVIDPIDSALHAIHIPFTSFGFPEHVLPEIPKLAAGATILPRDGGTLALLAEAGRPESVVDTGLLNRQLESTLSDHRSNAALEASMQRVEAILERIRTMGGITVEHIAVQAAPKEPAASSLPRALRSLAFELGN